MILGEGDNARAVIEQLWYRARINAFAHRVAAEEATKAAEGYFQRELLAALGAILGIILVYLFSTLPKESGMSEWILPTTMASIICTLFSLYESVMANYRKLDVMAARHEHLLNAYQFIAQRARGVKWSELPGKEVVDLLIDLERDFALLKATGTEPRDEHFEVAHDIVRKIRHDKDTRIAQSFDIGPVDLMAQHVGDPKNITAENHN
jgi:hypothetical protein